MRVLIWAALIVVLLPVVAQRSSSQDLHGSSDGAPQRTALLAKLVATDHIDKRIVDAFAAVPRERFLPSYLANMAYLDTTLPLGGGQTLPAPSDLLKAVQALDLPRDAPVLVVGADTGYLAALLSRLASHVYVVDLIPGERAAARRLYSSLGYRNISVAQDASLTAFSSSGPFPRIFVHGATNEVPSALVGELTPTGRMVVPLRDPTGFEMVVELERSNGVFTVKGIGKGFYSPIHLGS